MGLLCVIVTFLIFFLGPTTKITESCIEKNYDNINMCGSNDLSKYWTSVPSSTIKLNLLHLCYFCWKLSSSISYCCTTRLLKIKIICFTKKINKSGKTLLCRLTKKIQLFHVGFIHPAL